ncbi:MAG TPA: MarR family winged helix-turn-helix transcriptional regulator [Candidatus Binataceae bacterium]|nr:MarR family winged helix-turn-helix transcriptional regulator [Candidatus Binataceae bacterium]
MAYRIRMLNRMVTSIYDEELAKAGLKISQFSVLVAVIEREKSKPKELAAVLQMDESTLSRNVERMCARGWLKLEPEIEDRRSHVITITDKGKAMVLKAYPGWQKAQAETVRQLGEDGVSAVRSAVRKLRR